VVVVVVMDLYISTIACQYQHRMDEDHHHQLTNAILVAMNVPAHTEHAQIEPLSMKYGPISSTPENLVFPCSFFKPPDFLDFLVDGIVSDRVYLVSVSGY
jgi:hypothetical protein